MYLKIHQNALGTVVAVCDANLLGRVLSDGKLRLDLHAHAGFYKGEKATHKSAVAALAGAKNINVVGERALAAAAEAGIDTSGAIRICGVPHLQAYRV